MKGGTHACSVVLCVFTAFTACRRTAPVLGQLMVTIQTDAPLPDFIDGIRLKAFRENAGSSTLIFDREPEVRVGAGELLIPTTLAIVGNGSSTDRVRLQLLARKNGEPRILREAVTQIPADRIAEIYLAIEWLCDGSATVSDPMFCNDPEYTCSGGRCVPVWVDPATLPSYTPIRDAADAGANDILQCFDVPGCFADAYLLPLSVPDCSIPIPVEGLARFNLALVVTPGSGGQCVAGGNCLIALSRGSLGWEVSTDGVRIRLPSAVCTTRANQILGVVGSRRCAGKKSFQPLCGVWSPFVQVPDAGMMVPASGSDGGVESTSCTADPQCTTGYCVLGVCCDSRCDGTCRRCNLPGKVGVCTNLPPGTVDTGGTCIASEAADCGADGSCDGFGGCRFWAKGTSCGTSICVDQFSAASSLSCDGLGLCFTASTQCGLSLCANGVCLSPCRGPTDCIANAYCSSTADCVLRIANGADCESNATCLSGNCVGKICCDTACSETCVSCSTRGNLGSCKAVPFGTSAPGQCSGANVCSGLKSCTVPPLASLNFDTNSGSNVQTPPGSIGTGIIRSGAAIDSPAVAAPVFTTGISGSALRLDGIDQFVTFPHSAALDKFQSNNAFTFAAWIKIRGPANGLAWLLSHSESGGSPQLFGLGLQDGKPLVRVSIFDCPSVVSVVPETWVHIAATYNGLSSGLYVNGVLECSLDFGFPLSVGQSSLVIGGRQGVTMSEFWRGDIDALFLLDRTSTQAEIVEMMNAH
jgi:Concanavalin A-like lectin/glucanases superfamily